MKQLFLLLLLLCLASPLSADVKVTGVFSDNMVLQRGEKIPLWGAAAPGEQVTASVAGQTKSITADEDGRWKLYLDPLTAGGPFELTIAGNNTITIKNVLVGEVWLASGQSNMDFKVKDAINGEQEVAEANYPQIRLYKGRLTVEDKPLEFTDGSWTACTPESAKNYSAVAYFFARDLYKNLNVPVGIMWVSCGWTPAGAWTSREGLSADPEIKRDVLEKWDQIKAAYPAKKEAYEAEFMKWKEAKQAAEAEDKPFDEPQPKAPANPRFIHMATGLFNGGIAPIAPYGMKGVIWYQGETNSGRAIQYRKLFPLLINDWRNRWNKPEMPFLFVQIANLFPKQTQPEEGDRAELREAQLLTFKKMENTAMAVTIDIGDAKDEHPKNKQDVGARLALGARAVAYGQKIEYSGPIYREMKLEDGKIRLYFDHVGSGLVTKDGGPLKGFAIAGEDRKFLWADAKIEGDTIVVWSEKVSDPVAVRYGWANNPIISLYNREGLPAPGFRTDDWPGITTGKTKLWIEIYGGY